MLVLLSAMSFGRPPAGSSAAGRRERASDRQAEAVSAVASLLAGSGLGEEPSESTSPPLLSNRFSLRGRAPVAQAVRRHALRDVAVRAPRPAPLRAPSPRARSAFGRFARFHAAFSSPRPRSYALDARRALSALPGGGAGTRDGGGAFTARYDRARALVAAVSKGILPLRRA